MQINGDCEAHADCSVLGRGSKTELSKTELLEPTGVVCTYPLVVHHLSVLHV